MNKKSRRVLGISLIIGAVVLMLVLVFILQLSESSMVIITVALIGSIGTIMTIILSSKTNKVMDTLKIDVSEIKEEQISFKKNLNEVEMTITKKDLADAEKFQINFNGMKDIKDMMEGKKNIANLGKSIILISKSIIKKYWKLNDELKDFLRKLSKQYSDYITKQYEYGLDDLDVYDYELTLYDEINALIDTVNIEQIDVEAFEEVKESLFFNVHLYIKKLDGIQDLSNGTRREKFETQTKEFIKIMSHQSADAYINFVKEIA